MGTTAEKLAYLKESKNQIKQALETPSNVMRDYAKWIKKYVDNQPTQVVTDGVCTNALDVPLVSLGVDGNSYQGENPSPDNQQDIEDIDGVNLAYDGWAEDCVKRIGALANLNTPNQLWWNASAGYEDYDNKYIFKTNWKKNTQYTFNVDLKNISATSSNLVIEYTDGTETIFGKLIQGEFTNLVLTSEPNKTIKYLRSRYSSGATSIKLDTFMVYEGTTPKPYLPHGCIGLEQSGKNLFNYTIPEVANGTILEQYENGALVQGNTSDITQTSAYQRGWFRPGNSNDNKSQRVTVDKETTLYISADITLKEQYSDSSNSMNINLYTSDTGGTSYTANGQEIILGQKIRLVQQFNVSAGTYYPIFTLGSNTILIENIQISTLDDTYEPYHEPKLIPIDLQGNSLAKVGDVKDLLKIYRNGDVEIGKNFSEIDLGTLNFIGGEYQNWIFNSPFTNSINGGKVLCPIFKDTGYVSTTTMPNNTIQMRSNYIFIKCENKTVQELNNILKGIKLLYQLAEPETVKLPSIEPIQLWEGTNNFKLITNLDTTFEMEYVVNKDYLETQNLLNIVEGENI